MSPELGRSLGAVGSDPSPVPGDAWLWPGELPFTAFGQWGADRMDLRVFEQDVWWVDRLGCAHRIEEMTEQYRTNVVQFLCDHVRSLHAAVCREQLVSLAGEIVLGLPGAERAAVAAGVPLLRTLSPEAWLEGTPLMRRLRHLG